MFIISCYVCLKLCSVDKINYLLQNSHRIFLARVSSPRVKYFNCPPILVCIIIIILIKRNFKKYSFAKLEHIMSFSLVTAIYISWFLLFLHCDSCGERNS